METVGGISATPRKDVFFPRIWSKKGFKMEGGVKTV